MPRHQFEVKLMFVDVQRESREPFSAFFFFISFFYCVLISHLKEAGRNSMAFHCFLQGVSRCSDFCQTAVFHYGAGKKDRKLLTLVQNSVTLHVLCNLTMENSTI